MELRPIDNFYLQQEEPVKSCLLFLRQHLLAMDEDISEAWKYNLPFFLYQGRMLCYFWFHKKYRMPYIGIVDGEKLDHPELLLEKRKRMKILLIDPGKDLPMKKINGILKDMLDLYR